MFSYLACHRANNYSRRQSIFETFKQICKQQTAGILEFINHLVAIRRHITTLRQPSGMNTSNNCTSLSNDHSEKLIIWVQVDRFRYHVTSDSSTNIHFSSALHATCPPWFASSDVKRLKKVLGTDYASATKDLSAFHQSIVTMEILRHQYLVRVVYQSSPQQALQYLSTMDYTDKKDVLVWLDAHQDVHPLDWMFAYDTLTNECGSIFPPREEIVWADFKIHAMQAFDRIAAEDEAYRTLTCYPLSMSEGQTCHLNRDLKTVLKRSHSCSAMQVKVVQASRRGKPACEQFPVDEDEVLSDGFFRWMHQEYVSSLVTFGEFRIFIATRCMEDGTREPYVVHVIRTWWTDSTYKSIQEENVHKAKQLGCSYDAKEVLPGEKWQGYPRLDYAKLVEFALHAYRRLQELEEKGFQSLDVGGRLDIGIAPSGDEFFINELTRWYGAHQFALNTQDKSKPGDKVCRALAKAFAETRGLELRDDLMGNTVSVVARKTRGRPRKTVGKTPITKPKPKKKRRKTS